MASINDITINITMNTKSLSVKGFGLPLILGSRPLEDELCEVYGEYASLEEMTAAGYDSESKEYGLASKIFAQSPHPEVVAVYCREEDASIADGLDELVMTKNDWYALLITERGGEALAKAGDWCAAHEKIFFGCAASVSALTGRNNDREAYVIHDEPDTYPEAAWVGLCLPKPIGSITWKWKSPSGVPAAGFSTTQLNEIRRANGQTFTRRSGAIYSNEGKVTSGEYIDNIMSRDYVKARLEEGLLSLALKSDKVGMDDDGLSKIHAKMKEVLDGCGEDGIIAEVGSEEDARKSDEGKYMYTISVPTRAQIPENDRAKRKVSGIKFSFTISGAVHEMPVNGTIEI